MIPIDDMVKIVHDVTAVLTPIGVGIGAWLAHRANVNAKKNGKVSKDTNASVHELRIEMNGRLTQYISEVKAAATRAGRELGKEEQRLVTQEELLHLDEHELPDK